MKSAPVFFVWESLPGLEAHNFYACERPSQVRPMRQACRLHSTWRNAQVNLLTPNNGNVYKT